jgi:hypothetical protein
MNGPTPESVAQAKHAMWEERAAVEKVIGRPISSEGRILKFPTAPARVTMRCLKCKHEAQGVDIDAAVRDLSKHIVANHMPGLFP